MRLAIAPAERVWEFIEESWHRKAPTVWLLTLNRSAR